MRKLMSTSLQCTLLCLMSFASNLEIARRYECKVLYRGNGFEPTLTWAYQHKDFAPWGNFDRSAQQKQKATAKHSTPVVKLTACVVLAQLGP